MFIEMAEQLEQARLDLLRKAAQISMVDDDQMMTAAINTVFNTLNGQLKSMEKEILSNVMKNFQFTADCAANKQENWEDESRKHLARMNQNRPNMHAACFGPHAPGMQ